MYVCMYVCLCIFFLFQGGRVLVLDWDKLFPPQLPPSFWSSLSSLVRCHPSAQTSSTSPRAEAAKTGKTFEPQNDESSLPPGESSPPLLHDERKTGFGETPASSSSSFSSPSLTRRSQEGDGAAQGTLPSNRSRHSEGTWASSTWPGTSAPVQRSEGKAEGATSNGVRRSAWTAGRRGGRKKGKGSQHALSVRKKKGKTSNPLEKTSEVKAAEELGRIASHPAVLAVLATPHDAGVKQVIPWPEHSAFCMLLDDPAPSHRIEGSRTPHRRDLQACSDYSAVDASVRQKKERRKEDSTCMLLTRGKKTSHLLSSSSSRPPLSRVLPAVSSSSSSACVASPLPVAGGSNVLKWGEGEGSRRNGEAREGEKNKGGLSFSREFRGADDVLIVRVEGGRCGSVPVVWQYDLFKQLLSAHEKKELQAEDLDGTTAFFFRKFSREVVHRSWLNAEDALVRSRAHFCLPLQFPKSSSIIVSCCGETKTASPNSLYTEPSPSPSKYDKSKLDKAFLPVCSPTLMAPQFFIPQCRGAFWRRERGGIDGDEGGGDRWEERIWRRRRRGPRKSRASLHGHQRGVAGKFSPRREDCDGRLKAKEGRLLISDMRVLTRGASASRTRGEGNDHGEPQQAEALEKGTDREPETKSEDSLPFAPRKTPVLAPGVVDSPSTCSPRGNPKVSARIDCHSLKEEGSVDTPERSGDAEDKQGGGEKAEEGEEQTVEERDGGEQPKGCEGAKKDGGDEGERVGRVGEKRPPSPGGSQDGQEAEGKISKCNSSSLDSVDAPSTKEREDSLSDNQACQDSCMKDSSDPTTPGSSVAPVEADPRKRESADFFFSKDPATATLSELVDYLLSSSPPQPGENREKEKKKPSVPLSRSFTAEEHVPSLQEDEESQGSSASTVQPEKRKETAENLGVSRQVCGATLAPGDYGCNGASSAPQQHLSTKRRRRRNLMQVLFESAHDSQQVERGGNLGIECGGDVQVSTSSFSSLGSRSNNTEEAEDSQDGGCQSKSELGLRKGGKEDRRTAVGRAPPESSGSIEVARINLQGKIARDVRVTRMGPEALDRWLHLVAVQDFDTDEVSYQYSEKIQEAFLAGSSTEGETSHCRMQALG